MTNSLNLILLIGILSIVFEQVTSREYGAYSTSYVYLSAVNRKTGKRVDVCSNYQQYRSKNALLAETFEEAEPFSMKWWRDTSTTKRTEICPLPDRFSKKISFYKDVVPLDYRIYDDGTNCTRPFTKDPTSFRNASQFQEDTLRKYNASVAVFLVERGKQFVQGWKDYLFSDFYDPYINNTDAIPTFFIYKSLFNEKVLGVIESEDMIEDDLELRFHRPKSLRIDLSMLIIWFIAMICVSGGGFWAFYRHRLGKDLQLAESTLNSSSESTPENQEKENACCAKYGNYFAICLLMSILIVVIMLGYYFRTVLVFFFNMMLVIFGTSSCHSCFRALLSNFEFSKHGWYNAKFTSSHRIFGKIPEFSYTGLASVLVAFTICINWYIFRLSPYAFILLDFINITVCLHILRSLRLPSLKWIFILMVCMFVYDAIMVFATPMWTKNGCSVMLEVATGIDCSSGRANASGYPLPPSEVGSAPEKFPMLMQVMHFDPMLTCIDLEVERSYQMTILGLGDIIIPGYLISHSFTMNGFGERTRLIYGIVCIIGYGVGLIATFIALTLMKMAQPALIYLVPFTLTPICICALIRGEFLKVWHGVPFDKAILNNSHDSNEDGETMAVASDSDRSEEPLQNVL